MVGFGAGVVVTSKGDVVSLREGQILKQLAFPEREYPDPPPPVTEPMLHFAARFGTEKTIRNLIGSGSDVNLVGSDGCTALHVAATKGRLDVVRILLELGADTDKENASGETAAQAAGRAGQSEIAGILTAHSR
jgi:ankyrin repeat protein